MKIVFFGTPEYVIPVLENLYKKFKSKTGEPPIAAVVTQKPKPAGRKKLLEYSPVDSWAHKRNIPIFFNPYDLIKQKIPADIGVLASYGNIVPNEVIHYFKYGILVIHPSLLPQFRWSSPVPAAIITGTNPTGVTIIKMDGKFDHGPIVARFKEEVLPEDTYQTLRDRLFALSAPVTVNVIEPYLKGKIKLKPQDDSKATYARMITKKDAFIPPKYLNAVLRGLPLKGRWKIDFMNDYSLFPSAYCLERFIRAMQPWPIAWTTVKIKNQKLKIKILKSHLEKQVPNAYCLVPDTVQLEGKNPVTWKQFKEGYTTETFG